MEEEDAEDVLTFPPTAGESAGRSSLPARMPPSVASILEAVTTLYSGTTT